MICTRLGSRDISDIPPIHKHIILCYVMVFYVILYHTSRIEHNLLSQNLTMLKGVYKSYIEVRN
jgi:hypothetical protein